MKVLFRMLRTTVRVLLIGMIVVTLASLESRAATEGEEFSISKGYATAYCLKGTTASGLPVQAGVCAMNKQVVKEQNLMGKYVVLFQRLPDGTAGKEIGTYLIADTGCKKNVVDVWCSDLEKCKEFMNLVYEDGCKGKIFYQIVEEENELGNK